MSSSYLLTIIYSVGACLSSWCNGWRIVSIWHVSAILTHSSSTSWNPGNFLQYLRLILHKYTSDALQYLLYDTANTKASCTVSRGWAPIIGAFGGCVTHSSVSITGGAFIVLELDNSKQWEEAYRDIKINIENRRSSWPGFSLNAKRNYVPLFS